MTTDYDAPRKTESDDAAEESIEALAGRRNDVAVAVLDVDEGDEFEADPRLVALKLHVWRSVKEEVEAARAAGVAA